MTLVTAVLLLWHLLLLYGDPLAQPEGNGGVLEEEGLGQREGEGLSILGSAGGGAPAEDPGGGV